MNQAAPPQLSELTDPLDASESPFEDDWNDGRSSSADDVVRHGEVMASLALIYLRHSDAARAMVLGLAAMAMGDLSPATVLTVAESMLLAGDPQQSLAVLSRFDRYETAQTGLSMPPDTAQLAARHYISARVLFRLDDTEGARAALARAREFQQGVVPE
ncbi:hypothetical protein [Paracoccus sp. (in: a-proteobacteria)]|uniref:hypothetical protein n=1 Tax=Paracoccus sp. TaxID=267 RepID=UPI003A839EE1